MSMLAAKLARLPESERKVGKFAGVRTRGGAAEQTKVGERSTRRAREVFGEGARAVELSDAAVSAAAVVLS